MGAIHAWAQANPQRVPELLASNPSYVFFSTRPDSNEGPRGSLNVPLTAGYSVAIDRKVIPLGSLLWLSTTRPDGSPVVRPVGAQDTGGAITGEVRADLFWGTGPEAGELAGNMKQQGQIWMLWPKGQPLPEVPRYLDRCCLFRGSCPRRRPLGFRWKPRRTTRSVPSRQATPATARQPSRPGSR